MAITESISISDIREISLSNDSSLLELKALREGEGWGDGAKDLEYYLASGKCRVFAIFFDEKPIAWMLLVNLGSCCFIGSFITEPEFRGRGYGRILLKYVIDLEKKPYLLYSVPRTLSFYARNGFCSMDHVLKRVTFELPAVEGTSFHDSVLPPLSDYEINKLLSFDKAIVGPIERSSLLKIMLSDHKKVIASLHIANSDVKGYGILRFLSDEECRFSLYSNDHESAETIVKSLVAEFLYRELKCKFVVADIPIPYFASVYGVLHAAGLPKLALKDEELTTMAFLAPKSSSSLPFLTVPSLPHEVKHCAVLFMEAG